jgi:putative transposase
VSPRTVNKYLPRPPRGRSRGDLRWSTFLRLHAQGIIACDFFVAVTATFRLLYVFVVIEHHSRRLIHCNVTAHPCADWTLQQLREAVGFEERYAYLLHDRDSIFAKHLDDSIGRFGVKVLKSPPRRIGQDRPSELGGYEAQISWPTFRAASNCRVRPSRVVRRS